MAIGAARTQTAYRRSIDLRPALSAISVAGAIIVRPETLDRWHRNGSRIYWGWKSRRSVDRPKVPTAIRDLVRASQEGPPAESVIRAAVTLKHLAAALLVHVVPLLNERRASTSCFKISNAAICA